VSVLRFVLGALILAVVSTVFITLSILFLPSRVARVKINNGYGKILGRTIIWLAGVTPHFTHRERLQGNNPAIFVSNHASTLDMFLGIWLCPWGACGVMKKEMAKVPFFGWLAVLSGHLLLDRGNHDKAIQTLSDAADFVRKNRLGVWILPEGTRSKDGRLQPFKKGFVHLAIQAQMKVVPVIIHGAHRNWQKGRLLDYTPMDLDIEVLEPIDTTTWKMETSAEHAQAVYEAFAKGVREDQKPLAPPSVAVEAKAAPVVKTGS
jgi:1-acyl-sn-glycerol-3-phosphate acyltransferase